MFKSCTSNPLPCMCASFLRVPFVGWFQQEYQENNHICESPNKKPSHLYFGPPSGKHPPRFFVFLVARSAEHGVEEPHATLQRHCLSRGRLAHGVQVRHHRPAPSPPSECATARSRESRVIPFGDSHRDGRVMRGRILVSHPIGGFPFRESPSGWLPEEESLQWFRIPTT